MHLKMPSAKWRQFCLGFNVSWPLKCTSWNAVYIFHAQTVWMLSHISQRLLIEPVAGLVKQYLSIMLGLYFPFLWPSSHVTFGYVILFLHMPAHYFRFSLFKCIRIWQWKLYEETGKIKSLRSKCLCRYCNLNVTYKSEKIEVILSGWKRT